LKGALLFFEEEKPMRKSNLWLTAALSGGLLVARMNDWVADLNPVAGHKLSGTAVLTSEAKGKTSITLTLSDAEPNAMLQWHLNKGPCAMTSAPVYPRSGAFPPLRSDQNGRVSTTVMVAMDIDESVYSVRVHEKASGASSYDPMARDTTMRGRDPAAGRDPTRGPTSSSMGSRDEMAACGDLRPKGSSRP
jgi:hypothetical protein